MVTPEYMSEGTNTPEEEFTPQDILSERPLRPFTKEHTKIGHPEPVLEIINPESTVSNLPKKEEVVPESLEELRIPKTREELEQRAEEVLKGPINLDNILRKTKEMNPNTPVEELEQVAQKIIRSESEPNSFITAEDLRKMSGDYQPYISREATVNMAGPNLNTESITIRTERGVYTVEWPKDNEAKREYMRQILWRVEQTKEADGGLVNRPALVEASQIIPALAEKAADPKQNLSQPERLELQILSQELNQEFNYRLFFHQLYLQYEKAGSAGDDFNIIAQMRKEHLNFFFKELPQVGEAFNKLEEKADNFLITTPDGRSQIREEITQEINADEIKNPTLPPILDGTSRDFHWAQQLGERLWEITGRGAIREKLLYEGKARTLEEIEELDKQGKNVSSVRFLRGDVSGGTFAMRRILKVKEYLYASLGPLRPQMKLLKDVDFRTKDYISWVIGGIEGYHRNKIYQDLTEKGLEHDEADSFSKEAAYLVVKDIFGGLEKERPKDESGKLKNTFIEERENLDQNGNPVGTFREVRYVLKDLQGKTDDKKNRSYEYEWSWPTLDNAESAKYVTNIKWDQIDFNIGGDNPMLPWALYNVSLPDGLRTALTEETGSFLRKPSYDSLKALNKSLEYQQGSQYETRAKLLGNLIKFLRFDNRKTFGVANLNFAAANNLIDIAARENYIPLDRKEEVKKETLDRSDIIRKVRMFSHYFNILEFLLGILQSGAKSAISK